MRPTLHNLQALRGIACLLVVFYHVAGWEVLVWPRWKPMWVYRWFGFAGVDIFFVLSGFIIAWAHRDQLGQWKKFPRYFLRRLWRIYPVLWVSCVLVGLMVGALGTADIRKPGWIADWIEWLLLVPRYDPFALNGATWSLYYEMMFYLAFGLLFLLPARLAGGLGIAWAIAIVAARLVEYSPVPFWAKMPLSPFVLEFLGGTLVAAVVGRGFVRGPRIALAIAFAWLIAGIVLLRGSTPDDLGGRFWARIVAFGPPCVLLVYAVVAGEITGRISLPRRLRPLGDASYSIYLMHAPVALAMMFVTWGIGHGFWPHLLWLAILIGSGIGAGWLLYIGVERPLLNLAKRRASAPALRCSPAVVSGKITSLCQHSSDGPDHVSAALPLAGVLPPQRVGR